MYEYNAICDRVIDGDTIDARVDLGFNVWTFVRVRLYEIDAPESRTRNEELEFSIDDGKLLKGFNDTVKELSVGSKSTVELPAKEAYGEYVEEAVMEEKKLRYS